MSKSFLGRGLSFPVSLNSNGDLQSADYEESVRQSVLMILGTAKGERVMRPDFGCGIYDRKKGVSSLPFQGESSKNFSLFQAPSF